MDTASRPGSLALGEPPGVVARLRRLVRGRAEDGAWVRPAFLGVIALAAFLYLWGLGRNGYANTYYSAAVLAGTRSWKAFFFGSLDAGNFITVDKPPASLWLMELSARVFGFSSWSLLVPEALLGVATVALVFVVVRRTAGPVAGLVAALVMALTPVAVVMFRYNNPDALLTFLLVAAAWALLRSMDTGRTRWLLLSAAIVGLAFDTKYLQAYLVLPALVLTFFVLGPGGWARRTGQLVAAGGALVVSSGWWMAIVDAIPAAARPFIGGSTNNSVLNLVLGYDGFGRLTGALGRVAGGAAGALRGGGPGGGGPGAGFGGEAGPLRLFNSQFGGEISWLLPLAAVAIGVGLWVHRRAPRTDLARAGSVLWGLWLLAHAAVFSFASGIVHQYYAVAMAPAVAGLVGSGMVDLWRLRRRSAAGGAVAAAGLLATAWWGSRLLARTPDFAPGLGIAAVALAVVAALLLLAPRALRLSPRMPAIALAIGLASVLLGPAAYAAATASRAQQGPTPGSGPAAAALDGGRLAGPRTFDGGGFRGAPPGTEFAPGGGVGGPITTTGGPGAGADPALIRYLEEHQGGATWLVAVGSAGSGASIQLATGRPVLAMGGFSGGDPAMTVERLRELVASGRLRYVLLGGGPGGVGGAQGAQSVSGWVTQNCAAVDYSGSGTGGLYDCSTAARNAGSMSSA